MEKSELNSTVILYEILVCYNCNASDLVSISISIVPTTLRCSCFGQPLTKQLYKSKSNSILHKNELRALATKFQSVLA